MECKPPAIPPQGDREDYICKVSTVKHGLWILRRDVNGSAYEKALSSGTTAEQAMKECGGIFYATVDGVDPKPSSELIEQAEAAYALLNEDPMKFYEALTTSKIEKSTWLFIVNTDPWFRPRGCAPGEILLRDEEGPGVWVICGSSYDQARIMNNRDLKEDDMDLIKKCGGVYYADVYDIPGLEPR